MSIDRPEHGPRRYLCRIVLPVALLTASAIVLLHAWVEADLRAHLLLQSSSLSETGVVHHLVLASMSRKAAPLFLATP